MEACLGVFTAILPRRQRRFLFACIVDVQLWRARITNDVSQNSPLCGTRFCSYKHIECLWFCEGLVLVSFRGNDVSHTPASPTGVCNSRCCQTSTMVYAMCESSDTVICNLCFVLQLYRLCKFVDRLYFFHPGALGAAGTLTASNPELIS